MPAQPNAPEPITVEVWSDLVCPWCRIGHAHLQAAIAAAGVPVEVVHRAFQLDAHAKVEPIHEALRRRYGARANVAQMFERVRRIGESEGITFRFDQALSAPSALAHQVVLAAARQGQQLAVMEAFMAAHFEQGLDISSAEVIQGAATSAGMDAAAVEQAVADPALAAQVEADQRRAHQLGITGVPFFLVGRHGVAGAQPASVLKQLLTGAPAA